MNKLSEEDKEDLLGYGIGILIAGCLLMFVLIVKFSIETHVINAPEPYQAKCRGPGHIELPEEKCRG
jgi:hypothetical protein